MGADKKESGGMAEPPPAGIPFPPFCPATSFGVAGGGFKCPRVLLIERAETLNPKP